MTRPSKGAAVFLTLFGLPFLAAGLAFIYKQLADRGSHTSFETVVAILFGSVFAFIGGGLMYAGIRGNGYLKVQAAREQANPLSPWLWRSDWASRRSNSQNRKSQYLLWVLAIICNIVTLPFLVAMFQQFARFRNPIVLILLGFNLIGVILAVAAIKATVRHRRFGDAYFEFESLPFSTGDHVRGRIHLRFDTRADHGIDLRLSCIRKTVTGSGEDSTTRQAVLWQAEQKVPSYALQPGPLGRAIPVDFPVPAESPITNHDNPHDQILWQLHAQANVPGVDYKDDFEIPVFRGTASSDFSSSGFSSANAASPLGAGAQLPGQAADPMFNPARRTTAAAPIAIFLVFVTAMMGFMVWRMTSFTSRKNSRPAAAAAPQPVALRTFSSPMTDADVGRVIALPAQDQAEELLERAIGHDFRALELFEKNVREWRGHIRMTDRMRQLEQRSTYSKDLRVRLANAAINLALEAWQENDEAADLLIKRAQNDQAYRAAAVYYLGMLAGRGVAYDRVHPILWDYARYDQNAAVRQWAVEGLRFLGKPEVLDELFISFTEDPVNSVRDRAGCNISDCGIFTRKQRMKMVPRLIDLARNSRTTGQIRSWTFLALQEITDVSLPSDPLAWSRWYEEHGAEKMAEFERLEWYQVRGDE